MAVGKKGPEHIEGPVGEVKDPQDPKGEGKARGDQEEQGAPGNSAHELVEENVKGHNSSKIEIQMSKSK